MPDAFLETSALIELVFGNRATKGKVASCIPANSTITSSRYVIFEVAKGFLDHLILLHNKAKALAKFSEVISYSKAIRYRPHFQGTVLGAIELYMQGNNIGASDEERLVVFRGFMRGQIRRGWREVVALIGAPQNDIGCRDDLDAPAIEDGLYKMDLKVKLCGKNNNCGVKLFATKHRALLESIRDELKAIQNADAETTARVPALRELYRNPKDDFEGGDCWRCGDVLLTVEAPTKALLVSKNKKHIEPIAKVAGQPCAFY